MEINMSIAFAAAVSSLDGLTLQEKLDLKVLLDQRIGAGTARLRRGDIVIYNGHSDGGRFMLAKNITKLVVTEMRQKRVVVKHLEDIGVPPFLTYPESLIPTGEKKELPPPAPKIRQRRTRYEF